MRRILLTGGTGQVGLALSRLPWPADVVLDVPDRARLDLADTRTMVKALDGTRHDLILSVGAYTAVDRAEAEPATAFAVNALAPAVLAAHARTCNAPIIHVSTDYVFSGENNRPWRPADPIGPINVYGASKAAGELAVHTIAPRAVIARTSWVISADGTNFVRTMLRLAETRDLLRVVDDQRGCPTLAADLARALQAIALAHLETPQAPTGTFHIANHEPVTWCGLARETFRLAARHGGKSPALEPITSADYPTPARRPRWSVLDTSGTEQAFGLTMRPWADGLEELVTALMPSLSTGAPRP